MTEFSKIEQKTSKAMEYKELQNPPPRWLNTTKLLLSNSQENCRLSKRKSEKHLGKRHFTFKNTKIRLYSSLSTEALEEKTMEWHIQSPARK